MCTSHHMWWTHNTFLRFFIYHAITEDDNLCFFRCLAVHKTQKRPNQVGFEEAAKAFFNEYCRCTGVEADKFTGVTLTELDNLARLFSMNITVFEVQSDVSDIVEFKMRSSTAFQDTMNIHLWENHFSYISDVSRFCKSMCCPRCQKMWRKHTARHIRHCRYDVDHPPPSYKFPGGAYKYPRTVFDELEAEGIRSKISLLLLKWGSIVDISPSLLYFTNFTWTQMVHFKAPRSRSSFLRRRLTCFLHELRYMLKSSSPR